MATNYSESSSTIRSKESLPLAPILDGQIHLNSCRIRSDSLGTEPIYNCINKHEHLLRASGAVFLIERAGLDYPATGFAASYLDENGKQYAMLISTFDILGHSYTSAIGQITLKFKPSNNRPLELSLDKSFFSHHWMSHNHNIAILGVKDQAEWFSSGVQFFPVGQFRSCTSHLAIGHISRNDLLSIEYGAILQAPKKGVISSIEQSLKGADGWPILDKLTGNVVAMHWGNQSLPNQATELHFAVKRYLKFRNPIDPQKRQTSGPLALCPRVYEPVVKVQKQEDFTNRGNKGDEICTAESRLTTLEEELSVLYQVGHAVARTELKNNAGQKENGTCFMAVYRAENEPDVYMLVTAYHVIEQHKDLQKLKIIFEYPGEEKWELHITSQTFGYRWPDQNIKEECDLAKQCDVSIIEITNPCVLLNRKVYFLPVSPERPTSLPFPILCLGFPSGLSLSISHGAITEYMAKGGIKHVSATEKGSSGSPVVDYAGHAIAVHKRFAKANDLSYNEATYLLYAIKLFLPRRPDKNPLSAIPLTLLHTPIVGNRAVVRENAERSGVKAKFQGHTFLVSEDIMAVEHLHFVESGDPDRPDDPSYLEQLTKLLQRERFVQVVGAPGFGKTTLALRYAWIACRENSLVAWSFKAHSSSALENDLIALLNKLGHKHDIPMGPEEKKQLLYKEIVRFQCNVLLIMDNVERIQDIMLYANSLPFNAVLIVTARVQLESCDGGLRFGSDRTLQMGALDRQRAHQFLLQKGTSGITPETADALLNSFPFRNQYSPLQLELTVKHFRSSRLTVAQFTEKFLRSGRSSLVLNEVLKIMRPLLQSNLKEDKLVSILIQYAAQCNPNCIQIDLLEYGVGHKVTDQQLARAGIVGLLQVADDHNSNETRAPVCMHPLVHDRLRQFFEANPEPGEFPWFLPTQEVRARITRFLLQQFPYCQPGLNSFKEDRKRAQSLVLHPHALFPYEPIDDEEKQARAELYYRVQQFYSRVQPDPDLRIQYIKRPLEWQSSLKPETRIYLTKAQGQYYYAARQFREAEASLQSATQLARQIDPNSVETAFCVAWLGKAQSALGQRLEALKSLCEAVAIRERIAKRSTDEDIETAILYREMSDLSKSLKKDKEAKEQRTRALQKLRTVRERGKLECADNQRTLYEEALLEEDDSKAIELHEHVLQMRKTELGEKHNLVAFVHFQIGTRHENLSKWQDAASHFERARDILKDTRDSNWTVSQQNLALVYLEWKGKEGASKAIEMLEEVLTVNKKLYPLEHEHIQIELSALARAHGMLGHVEEEQSYKQKLEQIQKN